MGCFIMSCVALCFFFNDTATTEIYTLSLHDALPIVLDLARGDFLERDREVVLRGGVDHRRRELVERPLAEVVVVRVDLTRALGSHEHGRVVGVDVLEELVEARGDHTPECRASRTMPS